MVGGSQGGRSPIVWDVYVEADKGMVCSGDMKWFVDHDVAEGGEDWVQEASGGMGGSGDKLGEAEVPETFEEGGRVEVGAVF